MAEHCLSSRGVRATRPALSYFAAFQECSARPWTPADPEGVINLAVAENKLPQSIAALAERLARAAPLEPTQLGYGDTRGLPALRAAVAGHLQRTLLAGSGVAVPPDEVTVMAGCGAVLDALFWCICESGDGVLIPAPFYPAFVNDLEVRAGCEVLPVPEPDAAVVPTVAALEAAAAAAEARGVRPNVLLLTNPANPTGVVYPPATVEALLRWACGRGLHAVVDEVYGGSIYGEGAGAAFESAAAIARRAALPEAWRRRRMHVVWGLSKDFCASGLRVGAVWSENEGLKAAFGNLGYFPGVGAATQLAVAEVLNDHAWVDEFRAANAAALRAAYGAVRDALAEAGLPHTPAAAAMFVWVDARSLLPPGASWEDERELWQRMYRGDARVLLTPGRDCHAAAPGFFRACFAAVDAAALPALAERLKRVRGAP